ncbi:MAG: sugar phosphate isomerase/epimerase [Opitutales bacterium]|nr:sugar phosphate isomerase/epimerase [Opitutales bacterium]
MKKILLTGAILLSLLTFTTALQAKPRKVAVQTYSFNRFSLEETIEKLKGLKIDGLEVYPGQRLYKDKGKVDSKGKPITFNERMAKEDIEVLKGWLKDAKLNIVSIGCTSAPDNDGNFQKTMEFCKEFGIKRIVTESPVRAWDAFEALSEKYGNTDVELCIHNHEKGSSNQYWNPQVVKILLEDGKYKHVFSGADVGHWSRCKIDPIKSLKTLKGKMKTLHFKDQKQFGNPNNQCVPFGTGELGCKEMLKELDKQKYDGWFVIEYEADWDNNLEQVKQCIDFLRNN